MHVRPHLLLFSANHQESLRRRVVDCEKYLSGNPSALKDVAHTLGTRREHLAHRAFCVTNGAVPLVVLPFVKFKSPTQVNFVFTGQGAQWAGMGKELLEDFIEFREDLRAMDRILAQLPIPPSWTIEGTLEITTSNAGLVFNMICRRVVGTQRDKPPPHSRVLPTNMHCNPDSAREFVETLGNFPSSCCRAFKW